MNKHKVYFYSPNRIEPWDYRNVFDVGIGGSETSHVEMATRLAKRGHEVISYTDLPSDCPDREFMGVTWKHLSEAQFDSDGLWIVYRSPATGQVMREHNLRAWLICQDVFYPNWKSEDVSAFEYVFGLCPRHIKEISHNDPANVNKLRMTSNGVNVEDIEKLGQYSHERNLKRLVWSSSPDRGLKELLDIFEIAYREDKELILDVYYGMDNIDKICGGDRNKYPWSESWKQYDRCHELPGVTWRGRIGQKQLRKEIYTSGLWVYPTWFSETSPIVGDSLVETLTGPIKIKDLAGKKDFFVWSCNANGKLSYSKVSWCGLTRKKANVIKITAVPGKGRNARKAKELTLTPDHEVMLADGRYIPAGQLKVGDRVKAFHYRHTGFGSNYGAACLTGGKMQAQHRLVAEIKLGRKLYPNEVVHHIDGNTRNNNPDNLHVYISQSDHASKHYNTLSSKEKLIRSTQFIENTRYCDKSAGPKVLWNSFKTDENRKEFCQNRAKLRDNQKAGVTISKIMKQKYGKNPWWNKDLLYHAYIIEQKSTVDIAKEWNTSDWTISRWLKKHNIKSRNFSESQLVKNNRSNHTITKIEDAGYEDVYCMEVNPDHNFIANGIVVHNCISCMEAQACGAIPITNPIWATEHNVKHGVFIQGSPSDPIIKLRYAQTIVRLANNSALQSKIREVMMPESRQRLSWEVFVDQWENLF